ncbi:MAG: NADPH-dependent 7-cyano-7-deazaguanine reductase QueF [Gammaproteobacteria bacterium]|nr:NADPH-dependent 7-cyano-7-deazaguanine reductase QueF [Gammaproteobacteria bacterium]MDH5172500.1 NADPH-dependent 7-cyano-7-deazaguanine reductase QueF [Gammaproteobacteria bacterium]
MTDFDGQGLLLGRQTPVIDSYTPRLLYPIPRATGRERIGCSQAQPFTGIDLWHAYEMSWLDGAGKPVVRVGRIAIPSSSVNMVESKSLKLYLNSLNNVRFESDAAVAAIIRRDIAQVVGTGVQLELLAVDDPALAGAALPGLCLDDLAVTAPTGEPSADMLELHPGHLVEEHLHTHLLRSLCPVTGQPDWASVWIHYRGAALDHASLLRYVISYRRHQEFHEQCVERMFTDIERRVGPQFLHIQAFYTRRGGLDINPFRSTDPAAQPLPRLNRQ